MEQNKTQQQRLSELIKANIAPVMKKAGFKRKGNWFKYEGPSNDQYLNVMSSRWNDRNDVDFTLEAYVMCKKEKPVYKRAIAEDRIGFLKGRKDNWYNLKSDVGAEELGKEIEQDVTKYVLPFFQGHENVSKRRKLK